MVRGCQAAVLHLLRGLLRQDVVVAVLIDLRPQDGLGIHRGCVNLG